jgi:site-specific DNA-methyltransferase (cytosine-N4-specific)
MSKTDFPKADNRKVLRPYSRSMRQLLKRQSYNPGERPSEYKIGDTSFLENHGGSIAHNLFELDQMAEKREVRLPFACNAFSFSNTNSNDFFMRSCRERGIKPHPARMHVGLAAFFIQFLTDPGDLVLDPFAGSNTTGFVAELLERRWISIDVREEYGQQSIIRFSAPALQEST